MIRTVYFGATLLAVIANGIRIDNEGLALIELASELITEAEQGPGSPEICAEANGEIAPKCWEKGTGCVARIGRAYPGITAKDSVCEFDESRIGDKDIYRVDRRKYAKMSVQEW